MRKLLERVVVLVDGRRGAAWNMAADEVLLRRAVAAGSGLLRVYGWERAAVSLGFFQEWEAVRRDFPGREAVRRWTGGGAVPHGTGGDLTYALAAPRCGFGAAECYRMVHAALAEELAAGGMNVRLAEDCGEGGGQCFRSPVRHDVLDGAGGKVAGAAQRRTREGWLHQGSLQNLTTETVGPQFWEEVAGRLAEEVVVADAGKFDADWEAEVAELVGSRYGTDEWNRRR